MPLAFSGGCRDPYGVVLWIFKYLWGGRALKKTIAATAVGSFQRECPYSMESAGFTLQLSIFGTLYCLTRLLLEQVKSSHHIKLL